MPPDHAERARALVGVRFRAQGRTPEAGLDCVGLVLRAFGLPDDLVRHDYRLRGDYRQELLRELGKPFRRIAPRQGRNGDVIVLQVAPGQLHLAIVTADGFVHADARRGKVVETPGTPSWPIIAAFRRRTRKQGPV